MAPGDDYLALAAKCDGRASQEKDPAIRFEWESMARAYRRLAEQADRNAKTDLVYETPPERPNVQQPQQQQQSKLESDE
jgi:hypothetical protein